VMTTRPQYDDDGVVFMSRRSSGLFLLSFSFKSSQATALHRGRKRKV
jgi:hypothetical protein